VTLATFCDDFLYEQTTNRQIDRADDHETPAVFAVEKSSIRQWFCAVGFQN
jgi:N-acetylglutamate synthase-like GNAT family acetyltransferase